MKYIGICFLILLLLLNGCKYEGGFICIVEGEDMVYFVSIAGSNVYEFHNFLPVQFKCYLYQGDEFLFHLQRITSKERIIISLIHLSSKKCVLKKVVPINLNQIDIEYKQ